MTASTLKPERKQLDCSAQTGADQPRRRNQKSRSVSALVLALPAQRIFGEVVLQVTASGRMEEVRSDGDN
jgi:hypothetical protein